MTRTLRRALGFTAAAALAALGTLAAGSPASALASESCPSGGGWVRVAVAQDGANSVTIAAPAGSLIIDTCIAAGGATTYLTFDPGMPSLTVSGPVMDAAGVSHPVDHCAYRATPVAAPPTAPPAPAVTPQPVPAPEAQATVLASAGTTTTGVARPRTARPSASTTVLAETGTDPALPATALALVLGGVGLVLVSRRADRSTTPGEGVERA